MVSANQILSRTGVKSNGEAMATSSILTSASTMLRPFHLLLFSFLLFSPSASLAQSSPPLSASLLNTTVLIADKSLESLAANETRDLVITNTLGPTVLQVTSKGFPYINLSLLLFSNDSNSLGETAAGQPTAAQASGNVISITFVGVGNLSPSEIGGGYSYTNPKIPPTPNSSNLLGGLLTAIVPPQIKSVCINGYCASPLFMPVPQEKPLTLSVLQNNVIYDNFTGMEWQSGILPGTYNFTDKNDAATMAQAQADCLGTSSPL